MSTALILCACCVVAFIASRHLSSIAKLSSVSLSGAEYILIGFILGPSLAGVLSPEVLTKLKPLVELLLGLLGFGLGLRLRHMLGSLPSLPAKLLMVISVSAIMAGATYGICSIPMLGLQAEAWSLAATLGAIACVGATYQLDIFERAWKVKGDTLDLVQSFGVMGDVCAVLIFGGVAAYLRAQEIAFEGIRPLTAVEWLVASGGVGLLCGVLFIAFIGGERQHSRLFLASVGSIIFASGLAMGLNVSPLFINLVAGATVGALSRDEATLREAMLRMEHPTQVLLFILAGATLVPMLGWAWLLVPAYLIARQLGLRIGAPMSGSMLPKAPQTKPFVLGLTGQGAFAVALAMDFAQLEPQNASIVLSVTLTVSIIQNLASTPLLRRALIDIDEIPLSAGQAPKDGDLPDEAIANDLEALMQTDGEPDEPAPKHGHEQHEAPLAEVAEATAATAAVAAASVQDDLNALRDHDHPSEEE